MKRREAEAPVEDEEEGEQRRLRSAHQEEEDVGAQHGPTDVHRVAQFTLRHQFIRSRGASSVVVFRRPAPVISVYFWRHEWTRVDKFYPLYIYFSKFYLYPCSFVSMALELCTYEGIFCNAFYMESERFSNFLDRKNEGNYSVYHFSYVCYLFCMESF